MKKGIELKWKPSSIKTYVYESYMLGIMEANGNAYKEWMLSNYIQLNCHDDIYKDRDVFFAFYGDVAIYSPYIKAQRLSWAYLRSLDLDLVALFKKSLELGYYLYFKLDEYYVPDRRTYGTDHYLHDNLIVGYNEEGFIVLGYNCRGICEKCIMGFDRLVMSLESNVTDKDADSWEDKMYTLRYIDADYKLNSYLIKESLYDYLHSISRKDKSKRFANPLPDTVYGLATYDKVKEYLRYLIAGDEAFNEGAFISGKAHIDNRIFRIIMEHKIIMMERIEYLASKMGNLNDISNEYKDVLKIAELTHNIAVKYQLTGNKNLLEKLIKNVEIIKDRDAELLGKLYEKL
ncbi:MAG: hypothetical protein K5679_05270 [Lachnospiraceae bacterium]|nr:hypothetical protein [Lachnospiraceae bacterium]